MKKILVLLAIIAMISCAKSSSTNSDSIVGKWKPIIWTRHMSSTPNIEEDITRLIKEDYYEFKSDGTCSVTPTCNSCATNYELNGNLLKLYKNATLFATDTVKTLNTTTLITVDVYTSFGISEISTLTMKRQ